MAPEGGTFAESTSNLMTMVADAEGRMERTGVRLLWGTANLFSNPRYAAGAATNPDPEVFAYAAAQVKVMLEATRCTNSSRLAAFALRSACFVFLLDFFMPVPFLPFCTH